MDRTGYQMGGIALFLAGLSAALGSALHGPQPQTLEAFSELGASWTVSHIAIGVLAHCSRSRRSLWFGILAGTLGEGWALIGSGTVLLGGVALLGIGAIRNTLRQYGSGVSSARAIEWRS